MKKSILLAIAFLLIFTSICFADTAIHVGWTPDPVGAPTVIGQSIIYDPDITIADNEVSVWTGSPSDNLASFTISGADLPNDTIIIRTTYIGDVNIDTTPITPVTVGGAVVIYMYSRTLP